MPISPMMFGLKMQDVQTIWEKKLSEGLNNHSDINLSYPTEANEVFATFPRNKIEHLNSQGYTINEDEWDGKAVRLVAAWNTKDNDVDNFLEILKQSD
jgi:threonine aldolase